MKTLKTLLISVFLLWASLAGAQLSSTTFTQAYTCDGTTAGYSFSFPIYDSYNASVTVTTGAATQTLTAVSHYTMAPSSYYPYTYASGGQITLSLGSLCPLNSTLTITRVTPLTQETVYNNGQALDQTILLSDLDKIWMSLQEENAAISNTIGPQGPPGLPGGGSDYAIDALMTYGGGTSFTQATIQTALIAIGTSNKATLLIRPGTWPIISNADWSAYTNVTFKFAPGAVISGAFAITFPASTVLPSAAFSGLAAAVVNLGTSNITLEINKSETISADLTLPSTVKVAPIKGNILTIATGKTLTINGPYIAGLYQTFICVTTGKVVFGNDSVNEVSPNWYGAVGDGVLTAPYTSGTDNSPFFTQAISSANNGSHRMIVKVSNGIYKLQTRVDIPSGVKLVGSGPYGTILYPGGQFNDANGVLQTTESGTGQPPGGISDLALLGHAYEVTTVGIKLAANGSRLYNVWLGGFSTWHVLAASTNQIIDTVIIDAGVSATALDTGIIITAPFVQVSNCTVYNQGVGIQVSSVSTIMGKGTISIVDTGIMNPIAGGYGLYVNTNNAIPVRINNVDITSEGGTGYENGAFHIYNSSLVAIANSHVHFPVAASASQKAFYIRGTSSNNHISNCTSLNAYIGLSIADTAAQNTVTGGKYDGIVTAGSMGVYLGPTSAKNKINGTVVTHSTNGIQMDDGADDNVIENCEAIENTNGIVIVQDAGSYNAMKNNHSILNTTADYVLSGTVANLVMSGNSDRSGIIDSGSYQTATTAQLADKTSTINTVNKFLSKAVWNSSTVQFVYATGTANTSVWNNAVGALAHTPI